MSVFIRGKIDFYTELVRDSALSVAIWTLSDFFWNKGEHSVDVKIIWCTPESSFKIQCAGDIFDINL